MAIQSELEPRVDGVKSADRALRVLLFLAGRVRPAETRTIASEVGLPKSSAYALLNEMRSHGFVIYCADRRSWGLGGAAYGLSAGYLRSRPLERLSDPLLAWAAKRVSGQAQLAELYGTDMLVLRVAQPDVASLTSVEPGIRLPACLTASGRAMLMHRSTAQLSALYPTWTPILGLRPDGYVLTLARLKAELAAAREAGYAVNEELGNPDLISVAAPVFGHDSLPIAAVGITTSSESGAAADRARTGAIVREVADELSAALKSNGGEDDR